MNVVQCLLHLYIFLKLEGGWILKILPLIMIIVDRWFGVVMFERWKLRDCKLDNGPDVIINNKKTYSMGGGEVLEEFNKREKWEAVEKLGRRIWAYEIFEQWILRTHIR